MPPEESGSPSARPNRPEPAGPCAMVIFGAAGDLTRRKLVPALYYLAEAKLLPEHFAVVGVSIEDLSSEKFRDDTMAAAREMIEGDVDADTWKRLVGCVRYVQGDFRDDRTYQRLGETLKSVDEELQTEGNYLFYLATPPTFFGEIVERLGKAGLSKEEKERWRRVVIEKPFGHDVDSAVALDRQILSVVSDDQVFRIDHYLGKETVQNILAFRFANGIFEPIWNRSHVDHVQISVAEQLGVEHRADYYEKAGALRDMVPNHLFQLLSLITMEPPVSFEADAVRNEKAKILQAIEPLTPDQVFTRTVRGQYGTGKMPDGSRVPAYRDEEDVASDSRTETFVALRLEVENWRWADVPFYLRTGKRLAKRSTEIVIQFKRAPLTLFHGSDGPVPNQLVLRIQPDEGISLRFGGKVPGPLVRIGTVDMDFRYEEYFGESPSTGYETLLYDVMVGDATLFMRADNVERAWKVVAPILDVWSAVPPRDFPNYASGSMGPDAADTLITRDGRAWRELS